MVDNDLKFNKTFSEYSDQFRKITGSPSYQLQQLRSLLGDPWPFFIREYLITLTSGHSKVEALSFINSMTLPQYLTTASYCPIGAQSLYLKDVIDRLRPKDRQIFFNSLRQLVNSDMSDIVNTSPFS